jgi:YHS domain-containing protein
MKIKSARLIIERNLNVVIYFCSLLYKHHFQEQKKKFLEKKIRTECCLELKKKRRNEQIKEKEIISIEFKIVKSSLLIIIWSK